MDANYVFCQNCHTQNTNFNATCLRCGAMLPVSPMPMQPAGGNYGMTAKPPGAEKKVAAGICGILLGGFGVHKFILGYTNEGVIMLVIYLVGLILFCGIPSLAIAIIGIIEGIMYLTKSDEEFAAAYVYNKKGWF